VEEQYTFTVLPAQIANRTQKTFITYFEGAPSTLELGTVISGGSVSCGCDPAANYSNSTLRFTPSTDGWCTLQLRGANGVLLLNDSVYVQPTPRPYFKVKGLVTGDKLPAGTSELALEAFHPSVPADYEVASITYEKLSASNGDETIASSTLDLANYQGAVWIKKVVAKAGDQTFESDQSFLITIEP
jgi:hypothetical protein